MAANTRIYLVRHKGDTSQPARLVRATHPANALRHVADGAYSVSVASQDDLESLFGAGTRVERVSHGALEMVANSKPPNDRAEARPR